MNVQETVLPEGRRVRVAPTLFREALRLRRLRAVGHLHEPPVVRAAHAKLRRSRQPRSYAQRKPWGYVARVPGDLVQIDTTPITVRPGVRRVHFTARDVVSRKDILAAYGEGSSRAAERFLREELPRVAFPVRAIQIDGGSEFKARFEAACHALRIQLFVLPPRSPKLNGHVERAHRTHQEEFYDLIELPEDLAELNALLVGEHLRQVLVVEPSIGRAGELHNAVSEGVGQPVVRGTPAVAMGKGRRSVPPEGGEEAATVSQGDP